MSSKENAPARHTLLTTHYLLFTTHSLSHFLESDRIAEIASNLINSCPDTRVEIGRTLDDDCRELFVRSFFRADTHAQAGERAEELAVELLCEPGVETVCWGPHVAKTEEMIADDE